MRKLFICALLFSTCSIAVSVPAWKNIDHVIVVILENTSFATAQLQPFQKGLAERGALLTNFFALTHPSQPNYIGLIAGDTLGVDGDGNVDLDATMFGDLLNKAGKTWKVYAEDYPGNSQNCFLGRKKGLYVRKHVPFLSFTSVQNNMTKCANIVAAKKFFFQDVAANKLPTFSFYIPNLDNDGHDTTPHYADTALSKVLAPLLANKALMERTLIVVTYDEDDRFAENQVLTLFVGSCVQPGARSTTRYDHYSLLRTFEEIFQVGTLGRNDDKASPILDVWVR